MILLCLVKKIMGLLFGRYRKFVYLCSRYKENKRTLSPKQQESPLCIPSELLAGHFFLIIADLFCLF